MGLRSKIKTLLGQPAEYTRRDFEKRKRYRDDYRRLAAILDNIVEFESILDVGCANGFLIEELKERGKEIAGIEASPAVVDILSPDLRQVVKVGDFELAARAARRWDLVACIEVAEHIEPGRSEDLVRALASAATSWIYFTAAPPGQGGHGHINCRPKVEWLALFAELGWYEDEARLTALKTGLAALENVPWLEVNSTLLARRPDALTELELSDP